MGNHNSTNESQKRRPIKGKSMTLTTRTSKSWLPASFRESSFRSTKGGSRKNLEGSPIATRRIAVCNEKLPAVIEKNLGLKGKKEKIEKFRFDRQEKDFISYCQLLDVTGDGLIPGTELVKALQYTFKAELSYQEIHQILEESDSLHSMVDYSRFFVWLFAGTDPKEAERYFVRNGMMYRIPCKRYSIDSKGTETSEDSVSPILSTQSGLQHIDNIPVLELSPPEKKSLTRCINNANVLVADCKRKES